MPVWWPVSRGRGLRRPGPEIVLVAERYWIETLGCPKNQVDSDKLVGTLVADGYQPAGTPEQADLVVVNTSPSSRRPDRSRWTPCWPCPTPAATAPAWW